MLYQVQQISDLSICLNTCYVSAKSKRIAEVLKFKNVMILLFQFWTKYEGSIFQSINGAFIFFKNGIHMNVTLLFYIALWELH